MLNAYYYDDIVMKNVLEESSESARANVTLGDSLIANQRAGIVITEYNTRAAGPLQWHHVTARVLCDINNVFRFKNRKTSWFSHVREDIFTGQRH